MDKSGYVSRGAYKLKGILSDLNIKIDGKVVLDVGASHGGFTQVALLSGASKVYAVDVGKGLLDWKLRNLPEVIVMENFNARWLKKEDFDVNEMPEIALIDVSFISLKKIIPVVFNIVSEAVIALLKPQFEASYQESSKGKGLIKDTRIHKRVIEEIKESVAHESWKFIASYPSAIKGKKGNQEYFLYYEKKRNPSNAITIRNPSNAEKI